MRITTPVLTGFCPPLTPRAIILAMKVSELGEFGLIDVLSRMVSEARDPRSPAWQNLLIGIGDDAAAWRCPGAKVQLGKIDALFENVHFTPDTATWREIGWKALSINLSDIAAMGGIPAYALVSLGLRDTTAVEDVKEMYRGMIDLASRFQVAIVGGNISRAGEISVVVSLSGTAREGHLLTRCAARAGEQIGVTGSVGGATGGLRMLTRKLDFDPESYKTLRRAFQQPWPRVAEAQGLVEAGVKCAIDISDGLVADLKHISEMSEVGARVNVDLVPVNPVVKARFPDQSLSMALGGGEDYELVFTAAPEIMSKVKSSLGCPVTVIGETLGGHPGEVELVDSKGRPYELPVRGWDHFAKK